MTHRSVCGLPAPAAWFISPSPLCSSRSLTPRSTNHRPDGCVAYPSLSPSTGPASIVVFLFPVVNTLGESLRFLLLLVPSSQSCFVCHHQNNFLKFKIPHCRQNIKLESQAIQFVLSFEIRDISTVVGFGLQDSNRY